MAINRYDSPAEAQFIDTYVPIPFEKLYTLGKQAKEEVDKALADAATAFKEWGEFQSLSQKDIQTFYDETKGKALPVVNDLIKNPDKIKTVEGRMALQSVINNVDSAKLSALRQSAENMAAYDKLTKELMMKGLYNPDWHYRDFTNYDSTQGMFNETPIAYMDINEISKPYMDQMEKGFITSDGMYDYYGNTKEDLEQVANAHLTDMINTPQGQMHIKMYMRNNPNISYDEAVGMFREAVIASNQDRIIRPTRVANDFAKLAMANSYKNSKGGGSKEPDVQGPTVYDQQFWSTDRNSDIRKSLITSPDGSMPFSDYFTNKEKLNEINSIATELSAKKQAGEISDDQYTAAMKQLTDKNKEITDIAKQDYMKGVRSVLQNRSGIGDMNNSKEVSNKKKNLFKATEDTLFDIAGDVNEAITRAVSEASYGDTSNISFNGFKENVYSTDLSKFIITSDYISKTAGIQSNPLNIKIKDGNGHEVDLFDTLSRSKAYVKPRSKGITDYIDGTATLGIIYDVYVPETEFPDNSNPFIGNDNLDDIEDQYGKGSIVTGTDKDGNEIRYFHTTAIRRIPSDFDATIYSHLGDKTEAGTSLSKERERVNIINHQLK